MTRLLWTAIAISGAALLSVDCSPHRYIDDDSGCDKARELPSTIDVTDELNVPHGDSADCKFVRHYKDAIAKVTVKIGSAFEKHDLRGLITVFNEDGDILDRKTVDPSMFKYEFEFDVVEHKRFYVKLKASEGAHGYQAQVAFAPKNPCAKCTKDEECVDGECQAKVVVCDPPCDEDEALVCVEGECVTACNPPCSPGYDCDPESRLCEKVKKKCPKCKRGYYCSRRRGKCIEKRAPTRKICKPNCQPGQICQRGQCVRPPSTTRCPPCNPDENCSAATGFKCKPKGLGSSATGPIAGRMVNIMRSGQSTVLYLNRGERHGMKRNTKGKMCGKHSFVVTSVFSTRSKGKTNASIEELGTCKSFVVKRK